MTRKRKCDQINGRQLKKPCQGLDQMNPMRINGRQKLYNAYSVESVSSSNNVELIDTLEKTLYTYVHENFALYYGQCILLVEQLKPNIRELITSWNSKADCIQWIEKHSCVQPSTNALDPTKEILDNEPVHDKDETLPEAYSCRVVQPNMDQIFGATPEAERKGLDKDKLCPQCGKMSVKLIAGIQDRSGDEPGSNFFECDCGYRRKQRG